MKTFRAKRTFWVTTTQLLFSGQVFLVDSILELPTPTTDDLEKHIGKTLGELINEYFEECEAKIE